MSLLLCPCTYKLYNLTWYLSLDVIIDWLFSKRFREMRLWSLLTLFATQLTFINIFIRPRVFVKFFYLRRYSFTVFFIIFNVNCLWTIHFYFKNTEDGKILIDPCSYCKISLSCLTQVTILLHGVSTVQSRDTVYTDNPVITRLRFLYKKRGFLSINQKLLKLLQYIWFSDKTGLFLNWLKIISTYLLIF